MLSHNTTSILPGDHTAQLDEQTVVDLIWEAIIQNARARGVQPNASREDAEEAVKLLYRHGTGDAD